MDAISAAQLHQELPATPRADDEIGRLAATMNRMLERLEERRETASAASCPMRGTKLRSPITTIRQHAE